MDEKEFMRQMRDLVDFGRAKDNVLTKDEIRDFCDGISLTEKQMEFVYAYLAEHRIHIPGFAAGKPIPLDSFQEEPEKEFSKKKGNESADSRYLHIYRKELRELPLYTDEDIEKLHARLRNGEEAAVHKVVEAYLNRVAVLAGKYRGRGVLLEDLIQEGNLELMHCVSMLCGNQEVLDYGKAIEHAVRSRLIELVDDGIADMDGVNIMLARINLLHEAVRVLAEEYGRIATAEELSEFTHMEVEEIRMYSDFTNGEIALGSGD